MLAVVLGVSCIRSPRQAAQTGSRDFEPARGFLPTPVCAGPANCCPGGYNKAARPIAGSLAELLQVLDLEDDGSDQAVDRQRLKRTACADFTLSCLLCLPRLDIRMASLKVCPIARSYRELSVKHHPDKSAESSGFQRVRHAYEILDDPVKLLLSLGAVSSDFRLLQCHSSVMKSSM